MSIASLRHEPQSFPERDTLDSGIDGHHWSVSGPFEESLGNLALNTCPTKSRAHAERPHPQRVPDDRIDGNAADTSQHAFRVRGKQGFSGSIEAHRARRPIARESI